MDFFTREVMAEVDYQAHVAISVFKLPSSMKDDIKGDLLLALSEKLGSYDSSVSSPQTFARVICTRKIRDIAEYFHHEKRSAHREAFSLDQSIGSDSEESLWGEIVGQPDGYCFSDQFSTSDILEFLRRIGLTAFEEEMIDALVEGQSKTEIAEKNHISESLVRKRLSSLREKIKKSL